MIFLRGISIRSLTTTPTDLILFFLLLIALLFDNSIVAQEISEIFRPEVLRQGGPTQIERQGERGFLIAGDFHFIDGESATQLTRILPDGEWDEGFRLDPAIRYSISDFLVQPDDKIVISGGFGGGGYQMDRLLPDGQLDPTFENNPFPETYQVGPIEMLPDGRFYSIVNVWQFGEELRFFAQVHRHLPDGVIDSTFDAPPVGDTTQYDYFFVRDLVTLPNGGAAFTAVEIPAPVIDRRIMAFDAIGQRTRDLFEESIALIPFGNVNDLEYTGVGPVHMATTTRLAAWFTEPTDDNRSGWLGFGPDEYEEYTYDNITAVDSTHFLACGTGCVLIDRRFVEPPLRISSTVSSVTDGLYLPESNQFLIVGNFGRQNDGFPGGVARLNILEDTLVADPTFRGSILQRAPVAAAAARPDGSVSVLGNFTVVGGKVTRGLARIDQDGSISSLAPISIGPIRDAKALADGRFVVYHGFRKFSVFSEVDGSEVILSGVPADASGYTPKLYGAGDDYVFSGPRSAIPSGARIELPVTRHTLEAMNPVRIDTFRVEYADHRRDQLRGVKVLRNGEAIFYGEGLRLGAAAPTNARWVAPDGSIDTTRRFAIPGEHSIFGITEDTEGLTVAHGETNRGQLVEPKLLVSRFTGEGKLIDTLRSQSVVHQDVDQVFLEAVENNSVVFQPIYGRADKRSPALLLDSLGQSATDLAGAIGERSVRCAAVDGNENIILGGNFALRSGGSGLIRIGDAMMTSSAPIFGDQRPDLRVWPNPVVGPTLALETRRWNDKLAAYRIYSLPGGELIKHGEVNFISGNAAVSVVGLPFGSYLIALRNDARWSVGKFIRGSSR